MRAQTRPEQVYKIRGDRTKSAARVSGEVDAAFKVHYRHELDAPDTHRVTDLLWENEAVSFADNVEMLPGMALCEGPTRPRGIETVKGYADSPRVDADPFSWWRRQATGIGATALHVDEVREGMLALLQRAPASIHTDLMRLAVAAFTDHENGTCENA